MPCGNSRQAARHERQPACRGLHQCDLDGNDVTFFGRCALTIGISDWELRTGYARRQTATSGESLATAMDEVTVSVDYRPGAYRWQTYGELRWDRRDSLTDAVEIDYFVVPGTANAAVRTTALLTTSDASSVRDTYAALLGLRYAFTPQLSTNVEGRYRTVAYESDDPAADADTFVVEFALRYDFAPKRF
jgi:hypothetical protein